MGIWIIAAARSSSPSGSPCRWEGPHIEDKFWIDQLAQSAQRYGFPPLEAFTPDRWLTGGDRVRVGNVELEVRHCPGHTPGHVIFFSEQNRVAWVGDVLFHGSIGRSDFPTW
jgi:glyoxylase-like metal-dependent hydrolase (beta-lactamase superfamily II)